MQGSRRGQGRSPEDGRSGPLDCAVVMPIGALGFGRGKDAWPWKLGCKAGYP